ncbi:MAG: class I mannose-6-phosphate isomerase [Pontixanthobacter sp.]
MALRELGWQAVEKIWGRRDFPATFGDASQYENPVGEIWFADENATELLVKYLFTSERLSVQVHPSDEQARAAGFPSGKEEAWFVLSADAGASVGIGFEKELSSDQLRSASMDGSIEHLLTWHQVKPGDIFYIPAGTVHAIGAGLSVLEIQQNVDVTYRLYDYGRPRELQLEDSIAASVPRPYAARPAHFVDDGREVLVEGPKFVIERLHGASSRKIAASLSNPVWLIPLSGSCAVDDVILREGTVWLADENADLRLDGDASLLAAYSGAELLG